MAIDFPVGTDFPANGDQIPDGHEHEGFYWDAASGTWKRICEADRIGDCLVADETVCDRLEVIQNDIIELEEEIDAIAPSVERGSWEFTLSGDVGSKPGKFTAYNEFVATSGTPTGLVQSIKSLWFNTLDNSATPHGFDNVEADQLLELFVADSPDYGLFEVVEVHDYTASSDYWVIDVNFVRTLETTTRFDNDDVCRLKIASAPSGGTSDLFVLKAGDTMTGTLNFARFNDATGENAFIGINVYSRDGNKRLLEASTGGKYSPEYCRTEIAPISTSDITNKEYVDGLWDFSQYPELPRS